MAIAVRRTSFTPKFALLSVLGVFHTLVVAQPSYETDSLSLKEVVIQATRASRRSPVPHTNLNAEDLRKRYHGQDVPFLLKNIPSLVENSDAGTGIGYTGMRIRGSDPTRINVTLNGIPLNDAESQGVFWVDLPDVASSATEIQVQRGVGTSTNGAGAFGATVNLDLSKVHSEAGGRAAFTLGSFNTQKYSAALHSGLLRNRLSFSGRASYIRSDGFIDRADARLKSMHLSAAWVGEKQSIQVHLLSGHERTYQAWNGVPFQYIDDPARRTWNTAGMERPGSPYPDEVDDYTQHHVLAHYKHIFNARWSLQLNGHFTYGNGYYEQYKADQKLRVDYNTLLPSDSLEFRDLVRRRALDNRFGGMTFALKWTPRKNTDWLLGGGGNGYLGRHFGKVIWVEGYGALPPNLRYYDDVAYKDDYNLFLKNETNLGQGLTLTADLQGRYLVYIFDQFSTTVDLDGKINYLFFNPKIGLSWQAARRTILYLFAGTGSREPNRTDFTESTPAERPRPEYLYDVESGIKFGGEKMTVTLNGFWMYYRDQLVLDGRLNDVGAYTRINIPRSYRAGVEAEIGFRPVSRLQFNANLALSKNGIERFTEYRDNWDTGFQEQFTFENTDLAFSPSIVSGGELQFYILPESKKHSLSATFFGKYVGQQFLDNTSNPAAALDPWFHGDLRLNWSVRDVGPGALQFIFTVHNLFNARYESNGWVYRYTSAGYDARPDNPYTRLEQGATYNQTGLFPQAGIHFMFSGNYEF